MKNVFFKLARLCAVLLAAFAIAGCGQPDGIPVSVERLEIILNGSSGIEVGQSRTLGVEVFPSGASGYDLVWTVSPERRATVDGFGTLTAGDETGGIVVTVAVAGTQIRDRANLTISRPGEYPGTDDETPDPGEDDEEGKSPGDVDVPPDGPADALSLFEALRGRRVRTGGWADYANGRQGMSYTNPASPIVICDERFPDPLAKRRVFTDALNRDDPTFIIVSGDIDLSDGRLWDNSGNHPAGADFNSRIFDVGSNTTLIGLNDARLKFGGLRIQGMASAPRQNVIIRNVTFWDAHDSSGNPGLDALLIRWAVDVWVDHNKFTNGLCDHRAAGYGDWHDTLLNVRHGRVTISWNEITNGREVLLVGSSDDPAYMIREDRRVTLHHNYFHRTHSRMPRTRGTQMHIYNNVFRDVSTGGYALGPGRNAHFVVQNNLFVHPISNNNRVVNWGFASAGFPAVVWSEGNAGFGDSRLVGHFANSGGTVWFDRNAGAPSGVGSMPTVRPWVPANFYEYALTADVQGLRALLSERAGPTLATIGDFTASIRN